MIQLLPPVAKAQRGRERVKSFCTKAFFFFFQVFWVLVVSCGISGRSTWTLVVGCRLGCSAACGIFFPQSGIKRVPCIAWQILKHWTPRGVPYKAFILFYFFPYKAFKSSVLV